ncbi:MAG: hypothetical protein EBR88_00100 [Betaproteobacteria bacterium]|nr:hypothetical protein [Betaproteobacteria bacterium]
MSEYEALYDPADIVRLYEEGFVGSYCDPDDTRKLLAQLPQPLFGDSLYGDGRGKLSLAYKAVVAFEKAAGRNPYDEVQTTGDCVSHAVRGASDVARANDPEIKTEHDWIDRTATEPLYGARGHSGQGASCSQIVRWASLTGGVMLRKAYPELGIDLTRYNASYGIRWGSTGVPSSVTSEASRHAIKTVSLITTWQQARDAIANGYGLVCCSGIGFNKVRDSQGMLHPTGGWSHAMQWHGADDTRSDGCRFCVQNSWGYNWVSGPKVHDQPEGSFWISQNVAQQMIDAGGTYAVSNVVGFPRRALKDWGAKEVLR